MIELQALDWFKTLGTIKHQLPNTSILVGSQGVNLPARQQNKPYNRQKGDKRYHGINGAKAIFTAGNLFLYAAIYALGVVDDLRGCHDFPLFSSSHCNAN